MRRKATEWEKIFAKDISHKGLCTSKIQKEFLKFNKKKTTQLKNEPKTLTDTSAKKIHKWQISMRSDYPHHTLLEKCKLK